MGADDRTTTLTLGRAEALVLFELLTTAEELNVPIANSAAERFALSRLHGALESALVEPFMPEYNALVDRARAELASHEAESHASAP